MPSILITGARVVDPASHTDAVMDVLVNDDAIARMEPSIQPPPGARVIDAHGWVAAPGFVDMHVHLRDPGQTHKEDIFTGCRAAAAGGVTSLLCMPNTTPAIDTPETVRYVKEKSAGADAHVYVCGAISLGLKGEEATDIAALKQAGVIALSDDGRPVKSAAMMAKAMQEARRQHLTVTAHCEDLPLAAGGIMNDGAVSMELGVPGDPAAAEDVGTAREIALAASLHVPVHICHVSTAVSAAMIRAAQQNGVAVTGETCPHYLLLTEEALVSRNANFRMNPPLRTEVDRIAMVQALQDGTLSAISTDHAPHTPEEKADFEKAPNGSIGMETSFAASYTALVKTGAMSLSSLIEKMTVNPASILHIDAGYLSPGGPADIVLLDENEEWVIDPDSLHGKSRNTPFAGMRLTGRVKMTICGGKIVYDSREE